jgi:voltage-gated potassium channel
MTLRGYERASEWPLIGIAVAFLVAYAWPILDPDLPSGLADSLAIVTTVVWVLFAVDYLTRLALAPARWAFVRGHPLDLIVLALPMFRPLRALRVVPILLRLNRRAVDSLHGQVAMYVTGAVSLIVFIASLAVLDAERDAPNPNITTFADALWWSAATVSTVGYGDRFPTTGEGRWVAVGLMLAGIALVGVVTATLAAWFVQRLGKVEAETRDDVAEVAAELRRLRADLLASREGRGTGA